VLLLDVVLPLASFVVFVTLLDFVVEQLFGPLQTVTVAVSVFVVVVEPSALVLVSTVVSIFVPVEAVEVP
jgi:hypothetical protein